MRSLNPTKSTIYFTTLVHKWKIHCKHQRQDKQPELDFKTWCYNNNINLNGKQLIKL